MNDRQALVRALYRKLLRLYPREFREQLAESMEQTFADLWAERQRRGERGRFGFALAMFGETFGAIVREHWLELKQGNAMKRLLRTPGPAAVIGLLLALPFACIFTLLVLNIQPSLGWLESLLANPDPDKPDVGGTLVVLGCFALVIVAFVLNLRTVLRARRSGAGIAAHPANLLLTAATLLFIVMFVGAIVIDQYPCWVGVPNCD